MGFLTRSQSMGLAALALGMSVFLSRILGLVRDKVISYYFGAGSASDIYFTAFVIPDFLNYLLAGGYFSITLVPLLSRIFQKDEAEGWRFFSAAVCWAALAIALLTIVAWIFAAPIAAIVAPGFSASEKARLADFLRIILPAQACFLPGACFTALLYYRKQFLAPALAPLVYNGCIIMAGVAWVCLFPGSDMEGFCWGVLIGAALGSLCLPVLAVRSGGMTFSPRLRHPAMKTLLLLALPLMLGQSIVALDEQFVRIFGSLTGEGGVSLLNYARRLAQVPVGVVAQAAGLASYPFLAALAASGDTRGFNEGLNRAAVSTVLVAAPLSLWMIMVAEPLMRLIFQQGSFTAAQAGESGFLLALMLTAVAFWAVQQILGRAFYAHQDTLTPAVTGTATTLATLPAYWFGARAWGSAGVAAAGVFGVCLYTLALWGVWRRRFGSEGLNGVSGRAGGALLLSLPACVATWGATRLAGLIAPPLSLAGAALSILFGGMAFGCVYLGLGLIFARQLCAPLADLWRAVAARRRT
jgi:putative peptidoglycan lipid II flippase